MRDVLEHAIGTRELGAISRDLGVRRARLRVSAKRPQSRTSSNGCSTVVFEIGSCWITSGTQPCHVDTHLALLTRGRALCNDDGDGSSRLRDSLGCARGEAHPGGCEAELRVAHHREVLALRERLLYAVLRGRERPT